MVEGFCEELENGDAAVGLKSLHFLTYGGAALKPHCGEILRKHGVSAQCTYGQTEVAGAVCFGMINGDLNALTPLPGISILLQKDVDEDSGNKLGGELVLKGCFCATHSYLPGTAPNARNLIPASGGDSTTESYQTGDLFEDANLHQNGHVNWLRYSCRSDDVLVHSTGEMTNPLQVELEVAAECVKFVERLIMIGDGLPSPVMLVQFKPGEIMDKEKAEKMWRAVTAAQQHQPAYSALSASRILVLASGTILPTSAKGNVIRSKCERMFSNGLQDAVQVAEFLETIDEEEQFDSLDFMKQKTISSSTRTSEYEALKMNSYFAAITGIVICHCSNNYFGTFELGSIFLCVFSLFAGMDDQQKPPTVVQCLRLLKIYAFYAVVLLPLYRCTASAACAGHFSLRTWGLTFTTQHIEDGDNGEGEQDTQGDQLRNLQENNENSDNFWEIDVNNYDRPGWFVQLLAQMKILSIMANHISPKHGNRGLLLVIASIFAFELMHGLEVECDPKPPAGLQNSFCYSASTPSIVQVFLGLLGFGFRPSDYALKFVFAGHKGFFYVLVYIYFGVGRSESIA